MRILNFPLKRATASIVLVTFALATSGCGGGAYSPTAPTVLSDSAVSQVAASSLGDEAETEPPLKGNGETEGVFDDSENLIKPQYVQALTPFIESLLAKVGMRILAVGAALLAGEYFLARPSNTEYLYYTAYQYTAMDKYAYKHINDFPNVFGSKPPSRRTFREKCKEVINSKSSSTVSSTVTKYSQKSDWRIVAYDWNLQMAVVGSTDGRTIDNCMPHRPDQVRAKSKEPGGSWKRII